MRLGPTRTNQVMKQPHMHVAIIRTSIPPRIVGYCLVICRFNEHPMQKRRAGYPALSLSKTKLRNVGPATPQSASVRQGFFYFLLPQGLPLSIHGLPILVGIKEQKDHYLKILVRPFLSEP